MADTVDELVRFHSAHDEAKPMVIDHHRRLSYAELDVTTHDWAQAFINAGVAAQAKAPANALGSN